MKIITLDISTKFVAYAVWDNKELVGMGKIFSEGKGDEALASYGHKVSSVFRDANIEGVVYEAAFMGNNVNVVKALSKATGSVLAGFYEIGIHRFGSVPPITWQTGIGVGRTSREQIKELHVRYPRRSRSWIKNKDRENRKQAVVDIINKRFGLNLELKDNDLADAIGIGCYLLDNGKVV
jgi:Holliday junction resolvasome RuvABC endonuclease subunit